MKVSAHITEDYGENVRNSGWIKLFSRFTQLMSEQDSTIPITHNEDLWQFQE